MYKAKSKPKKLTPITTAQGVENALKILEGRWKLVILFHLFGGKVLRFSDLDRSIPAISQKMLIRSFAGWRPMESSNAPSTLKFHPKLNIALHHGAEIVPGA
jgi:hypothetical protein